MSASLTVDCDSAEYGHIQTAAIVSILVVPTIIIVTFVIFVTPAIPYIKVRTKRSGVSPLVDAFIAKWKPATWHFAFIDVVSFTHARADNCGALKTDALLLPFLDCSFPKPFAALKLAMFI